VAQVYYLLGSSSYLQILATIPLKTAITVPLGPPDFHTFLTYLIDTGNGTVILEG
jgi:hypothetical protein